MWFLGDFVKAMFWTLAAASEMTGNISSRQPSFEHLSSKSERYWLHSSKLAPVLKRSSKRELTFCSSKKELLKRLIRLNTELKDFDLGEHGVKGIVGSKYVYLKSLDYKN